jgi:polysaccharide export outer membrane protein
VSTGFSHPKSICIFKNGNIKMIKNLTLIVLFSFLTGCTVFPGGHVDVDLLTEEASFNILPEVNVRFISPSLISELEKSDPVAKPNKSLEIQLAEHSYLIGKGDVLNITVWDHPELTTPAGQFRSAGESGSVVHSDGAIFYPYIGRVSVINKSVMEVRDLIAGLLAKYIESPQVDVSVVAFRSKKAFITGEVNSPSILPLTNIPMTLLDALNFSGGISPNADWRSVTLTSVTNQGSVDEVLDLYALYQKGDMTQNRLLASSDIVHVPRNDNLKVFVMGDVLNPSVQRIGRSHMSLAEALNNAGGLNEKTANASGVFVLRSSNKIDKLVDVFKLDVSQGPMLILSTEFILEPLDVVYVTSAPIARWNRLISQLLPTFSMLRLSRQNND